MELEDQHQEDQEDQEDQEEEVFDGCLIDVKRRQECCPFGAD